MSTSTETPEARATRLHNFAHTARIAQVLRETPNHPRRAEYAKSVLEYRAHFAALDPALREQTAADVIAEIAANERPALEDADVASALKLLTPPIGDPFATTHPTTTAEG